MTPEERAELEALREMDKAPSGDFWPQALETFGSAAAFGFGDEIGAAFNAITGMSEPGETYADAYSRLLDESNARMDQFSEQNPKTSLLLKVAPAVGTGIASAPKLLGHAPGLLRTAAVGVGEASLYGAGEADEGERLKGAIQNAPFGLIAPVAQGVGSAYKALKGSKGNTAAQIIDDAIEASGMTRAQTAASVTGDAMLADVSPQMKAIGMGVANMTPAARESAGALDVRMGGMSKRVMDAIKKASPGPAKRLTQTRREAMKSQSQKAAPLYKEAFDADVPVSPELESILKTPAGKSAFKNAQRIAGNEKRILPEIFDEETDKLLTIPDMQAWDDIKKGFDDVIEKETSDFGKVSAEGRRALILKNEMLDIIDNENPIYKEARATWAGDQAVINAMNNGKRVLNMSVDEVIDLTDNLASSERDAMLKGLVSDITEKMGRRADNTIGGFNFLNNQNARTKLVAVLGDTPEAEKIADNIIYTVARERNFAQTRIDVLGGSQTNIRKQAEEMLHGSRGGMEDVTTMTGLAREVIRQVKNLKGISSKDADELSSIVFDPKMTKKKLDAILRDYDISRSAKDRMRAIFLGASTGAAAAE